ncbi:TIGR02466 family protein [Puniceibacterium sediminis]|uniref:2OG-Fe(II) oxygenase superfamily protein n=1 Tax=Puniceibacterium sediminis TaxID=1608407 RepID=A0A238YWR5_9RHOB|nr:TIGR02466 family protein [Puniceibacterium sediminis]SNR75171.1 conserved hypothetical protein [Puniceibacterium sediminis]
MTVLEQEKTVLDASSARMETIFPTYLVTHHWPNVDGLDARLCAYAKAEMARTDGLCSTTTNVGGWHSPKSLGTSSNPDIQALLRRFESLVFETTARTASPDNAKRLETRIDMWCNVNGIQDYNEPHIHRDCTWVGVYYAEVPEDTGPDPRAGALEVFDPRPAAALVPTPGMEFDLTRLVVPQPGLMVLFPSWLTHMVHPFRTQGRRISFASNIKARLA